MRPAGNLLRRGGPEQVTTPTHLSFLYLPSLFWYLLCSTHLRDRAWIVNYQFGSISSCFLTRAEAEKCFILPYVKVTKFLLNGWKLGSASGIFNVGPIILKYDWQPLKHDSCPFSTKRSQQDCSWSKLVYSDKISLKALESWTYLNTHSLECCKQHKCLPSSLLSA